MVTIIGDCGVAKSLTPSTPEDQAYTVTDYSLLYIVLAFTVEPASCKVTYSIASFNSDGSPADSVSEFFNADTRELKLDSKNYSQQLKLSGMSFMDYKI